MRSANKSASQLQEQDSSHGDGENTGMVHWPWNSHGETTIAFKLVRVTEFGILTVRPNEGLELNQLTLLLTSKYLIIDKTWIAIRGRERLHNKNGDTCGFGIYHHEAGILRKYWKPGRSISLAWTSISLFWFNPQTERPTSLSSFLLRRHLLIKIVLATG